MDKIKYIKNILKESIEEIVSGFDNFNNWKQASSNRNGVNPNYHNYNPEANKTVGFVYHFTEQNLLSKMSEEGAQTAKEFRDGQCHGRGIYAMIKFTPSGHGSSCMKYAVKPGTFDKFVIFDVKDTKNYLFKHGLLTRRNESLDNNIKRLMSPEMYQYLLNRYKQYYNHYATDLNDINESRFYSIMTQGEKTKSENRLDSTEIEGWDYTYGYDIDDKDRYSNSVGFVFRSSDLLMPYKYYNNRETDDVLNHRKKEDECGTYAVNNDDDFNRLNFNVDAFRRGHYEYPDTDEKLNSVKGFALLKKGNKFNLINNITGKPISPVPMDKCSGFSPIDDRTQFSCMGMDFEIESPDYGKTINIYAFPHGYNGDSIPVPYEQFLQIAEQYKQQMGGKLNESFMDGNYEDFQKRMNNTATFYNKYNDEEWKRYANSIKQGKDVVVYTCSDHKNIQSMLTNGMTYEYSGSSPDNSMYHGLVAYCALSISGAINNQHHGYGDTIFSFILKDGLKDFIIWDDKIRSIFRPNESAYDNVVKLIGGKTYNGKSMYDMFNNYIKHNSRLHSEGIYSIQDLKKHLGSTGPLAAAFYDCFKGKYVETINKGLHGGGGAAINDELPLTQTNIRGYVYNGGIHHDCICIRDFNALMPIGYSTDGGKTFKPNPYMNQEVFDRLNDNVHPYYQYRRDYEKTPLLRKQTQGYTLVEGSKGYNYMYVKNHKRLLPLDADKASAFSPMDASAQFSLLGANFEISINNDNTYDLTVEGNPLSFEQFITILKQAEAQGILGNKTIYEDCMLNPANQNESKSSKKKTLLKESKMSFADRIRHAIEENDRLAEQNPELSLFKSPETAQFLFNLANQWDEYRKQFKNPNCRKVQEATAGILSQIANKDTALNVFKDLNAAQFFYFRLTNTRKADTVAKINNELGSYDPTQNAFAQGTTDMNVASEKERVEAGKTEEQKTIENRRAKKEATLEKVREDSLDALNFYMNWKDGNFPKGFEFADMETAKPSIKDNENLMPYALKDPDFENYMMIKNFCFDNLFYFDGASVKTYLYNPTAFIEGKDGYKTLKKRPRGWDAVRARLTNMGCICDKNIFRKGRVPNTTLMYFNFYNPNYDTNN